MGSTRFADGSNFHIVLFPFMSKGHTIPLLHFAKILLRRSAAVTFVTTPANRPFITHSLADTAATIATLPFLSSPDIPASIESTDKLPSMSLFFQFALSTSSMQAPFEQLLQTLPRVSFMVTDAFLWWTLHSANKFSIPRFAHFGMSCYSVSLHLEARIQGILSGAQPENELNTLTRFPWIKLSKEDFDADLRKQNPNTPEHHFFANFSPTIPQSYGILVNSFYELEPTFVDHVNTHYSPKSWCVGPFCFAETTSSRKVDDSVKPNWMMWLDKRGREKRGVVYVAFGSQAEISREQVEEIAIGLEESRVCFLWVIRKEEWGLAEGFEERVKERGVVVREWVDQREILRHESVEGFVSHCGWNSVLESVCCGVPIVAWPMMAEQFLNARMVEEELGVGLRVERGDGFVKREEVRKKVRELMEGEKGTRVREKVRELADEARKAVEEGGSSWCTLNALLHHTRQYCHQKETEH
ncbi:hypothetical protein RJT34_14124 [Clitoria ternatea]|uniref:Glycosyltransferase n=1 Tax=Clitoria ternatea TaxID=43366 RepID=A0AAN9JQ43_CLITE